MKLVLTDFLETGASNDAVYIRSNYAGFLAYASSTYLSVRAACSVLKARPGVQELPLDLGQGIRSKN